MTDVALRGHVALNHGFDLSTIRQQSRWFANDGRFCVTVGIGTDFYIAADDPQQLDVLIRELTFARETLLRAPKKETA